MSEVLTPDDGDSEIEIADERQARELVDEIKRRGARLVEQAAQFEVDKEEFGDLVGLAYRHRAWIALCYGSWAELARAEFSEARFFDSITARRDRVQALIVEGLSTRAIGDVLGISKNTAHRDAIATVPSGTVADPKSSGAVATASDATVATASTGHVSSDARPATAQKGQLSPA